MGSYRTPQRAAFVPARSSTPTPSQPTYVRPNFSPPLSPAPPLHAYSFSFCRARQFFLHHPLFLRCAVVRSSPSVFWSLCSHLRSLIIVQRAPICAFRFLISVLCFFLSLRYFRVFQWSCLRLFARIRLYTQNRLSVSLSFAHLAVLQPLVLVFPLGLFPSPIILLFLFAPPLLSPLFPPFYSLLPFFSSISLYFSLSPFFLFSLSLSLFSLSLSLQYFIHRRSTHFSRFIAVLRPVSRFPSSDALHARLVSHMSYNFFHVTLSIPFFTLLSSCSLSASSRKIIIYLLFPKCV